MDLKNYNLDTSEEEIIKAFQDMPNNQSDPSFQPAPISYLTNLLSSKYQKKILDSSKKLTYATWALSVTTAILAIITWFARG